MSALLDRNRVRLSRHATQRAVEMQIDPVDIAMTLACPDDKRTPGPGSAYYESGRVFYNYDKYTAVVEPGEKLVVVTFLWRYAEDWEKSYEDDPFSDRKRRANPFLPESDTA